jgi:hypothetical protein
MSRICTPCHWEPIILGGQLSTSTAIWPDPPKLLLGIRNDYFRKDTEDVMGARSQSLRDMPYGACDGRE